MITYTKGDATYPETPGEKLIVHICNDVGAWGAGFVLALSKRWKLPVEVYLKSAPYVLGDVSYASVDYCTMVCNMVAQTGVGGRNGPPIRYDALRTCLEKIARLARHTNASVHMPRIGCGLAGGTWDKIEPVIQETLVVAGVPVFVYDL